MCSATIKIDILHIFVLYMKFEIENLEINMYSTYFYRI